jgi:translation initiation factor 2 beta subunit (eIF-2beta)/eIF-5
MEDYEQMLEKPYSKIKKTYSNGERFEVPKIKGHFEGKRTILTNFLIIFLLI